MCKEFQEPTDTEVLDRSLEVVLSTDSVVTSEMSYAITGAELSLQVEAPSISRLAGIQQKA